MYKLLLLLVFACSAAQLEEARSIFGGPRTLHTRGQGARVQVRRGQQMLLSERYKNPTTQKARLSPQPAQRIERTCTRDGRRCPGASKSLSVLIYNTRDFSYTVASRLVNSYAADDRRPEIVKRIRLSGADIVGLSEVWFERNKAWYIQELQNDYPYSYTKPEGSHHELGNGLVILSKVLTCCQLYPILMSQSFPQYLQLPRLLLIGQERQQIEWRIRDFILVPSE